MFSWSSILKCNVHVRRVRHLRDRFNPLEEYDDEDFRLRFVLGRTRTVTSQKFWIKIFNIKQEEVSAAYTNAASANCFKILCDRLGTFQRVIGDLFGVSVFAACKVIRKVSRTIAKLKRRFLSIPENLADVKRKFYDIGHFSGVFGAID